MIQIHEESMKLFKALTFNRKERIKRVNSTTITLSLNFNIVFEELGSSFIFYTKCGPSSLDIPALHFTLQFILTIIVDNN